MEERLQVKFRLFQKGNYLIQKNKKRKKNKKKNQKEKKVKTVKQQ